MDIKTVYTTIIISFLITSSMNAMDSIPTATPTASNYSQLTQTQLDEELLNASETGNLPKVKELLSAGANKEAQDKKKQARVDAVKRKRTISNLLVSEVLLTNKLSKPAGDPPPITSSTSYNFIPEATRRKMMRKPYTGKFSTKIGKIRKSHLKRPNKSYPTDHRINIKSQRGNNQLIETNTFICKPTLSEQEKMLHCLGTFKINIQDCSSPVASTSVNQADEPSINIKDYWTLAQHQEEFALQMGIPDVQKVELLLKAGPNVNIKLDYKESLLHFSVRMGSIPYINLLINAGIDINHRNVFNQTAYYLTYKLARIKLSEIFKPFTKLHLAIKNNALDLVMELKSNNMILNFHDKHDNSALHTASMIGNLQIVTLLINEGVNIQFQNRIGEAPLHLAAKKGHTEIVKLLLSVGANTNALTSTDLFPRQQHTPLHLAARGGHAEIVKLLISAGATIEATQTGQYTPLHLAAKGDHVEVVKLLISAKANPNTRHKYGYTPLHTIRPLRRSPHEDARHRTTTDLLIKAGAAIDAKLFNKSTPLHLAAKYGDIGMATVLNSAGANIEALDKWQHTPLHWAVQSGHTKIVELLIKNGAKKATTGGLTPLHCAILLGNTEEAHKLLAAGANKNTASMTPLHWAAFFGNINEIKKQAYADSDLTKSLVWFTHPLSSKVGLMPVDFADNTNQIKARNFLCLEMIKADRRYLLEWRDFDLNLTADDGTTLLHDAAQLGHEQAIAFLLAQDNIKLNLPDHNGNTPLLLATKHNHPEAATLLINADANVNSSNHVGKTPLHFAAEHKNNLLLVQLCDKGAVPRRDSENSLPTFKLPISLKKIIYGDVEKPTFKDIVGLDSVIRKINHIWNRLTIAPMLGIKTPQVILLYGLKGTGKTLTAKAFSTVHSTKFFSLPANKMVPDLTQHEYPRTIEGIKQAFTVALKNVPAILFIDEIDRLTNQSAPTRAIIKTLLCSQGMKQLLIIACTNNLEDIPILLRNPLMKTHAILVPLPNERHRREMLNLFFGKYIQRHNTSKNFINHLAARTKKASGRDLVMLVHNAATNAHMRTETNKVEYKVTEKDFLSQLDQQKPTLDLLHYFIDKHLVDYKETISLKFLNQFASHINGISTENLRLLVIRVTYHLKNHDGPADIDKLFWLAYNTRIDPSHPLHTHHKTLSQPSTIIGQGGISIHGSVIDSTVKVVYTTVGQTPSQKQLAQFEILKRLITSSLTNVSDAVDDECIMAFAKKTANYSPETLQEIINKITTISLGKGISASSSTTPAIKPIHFDRALAAIIRKRNTGSDNE